MGADTIIEMVIRGDASLWVDPGKPTTHETATAIVTKNNFYALSSPAHGCVNVYANFRPVIIIYS
jgi:hypothetical protein